jgi:phage/plasmid-associated DNA primase
MATPKSTAVLAVDAEILATSFQYVFFNKRLYAPVDYVDVDAGVVPDVERTTWVPISDDMLQVKALQQFDTMFKDPRQQQSFQFMVEQSAIRVFDAQPWLLVKTAQGLRVLKEDGTLHEPDGTFIPNTIRWEINENADDKAELLSTITDWVGGDEEIVTSLLRHLATALAPHWSAGKYVLLIGNGRNGKSLLMNMLQVLFGRDNCSGITRQQISEADKALFDLNNKLLNIVFDGPAEFLKDSGREKSLITGEAISIRKLYANTSTTVQTNALFIEGLNQEPRSRDKSSALQARLVRFVFPNKYPDDQDFWNHMHSERMLGALLSLLIDHYVLQSQVAVMLSPSQASRLAQIEHSVDNSLALQFLIHLDETETLPLEEYLLDMLFSDMASQFQSWRKACGDPTPWDTQTLLNMFRPVLDTERKSVWDTAVASSRKKRVISGLTEDTMLVINALRGEDAHATAVVDD